MKRLNRRYRDRLGIPHDTAITMDNLKDVLEKAAKTIPFENLAIIENRVNHITKENVMRKIIDQNEGGLCYELNAIFYFFLTENGFQAKLVRAMTFENSTKQWRHSTGKTHVMNIIEHNGQLYIADVGFGANSPLTMVPLTGETVTSNNGQFKVKRMDTEYGDAIFYMKLKHKDTDWKIGYAFDSQKAINGLRELDEIQHIIAEHPESGFNKRPLITKFTDQGTMTLTDTSFTEWTDGKVKKKEIDHPLFHELKKQHFNL